MRPKTGQKNIKKTIEFELSKPVSFRWRPVSEAGRSRKEHFLIKVDAFDTGIRPRKKGWYFV
jgi:hypothetical protein